MKLSSFFIITNLAFLLQLSSAATSDNSSSSSSLDNFLKCLGNHDSQPSRPISAAIYTPNHPLFSPLLLNRTANRRHITPTTPKPLAIIAAQHPSHVQATIKCANSNAIQIRIRSGGHDYEGLSYVSHVPFIVLDMFNLHSIEIDLTNHTAWVQSGATIGQLYYSIAKISDVLGFPAGVTVTVGLGGHFSGGGYGNLMRKYGLSVDNVVDANLIDVNGRILNRKSMGEDVFWAIRGGGAASFGVVLSWKIKLVSVPPRVTVFKVKRTLEQGLTDLVYKWQLIASELDEDLFIRMMPQVIKEETQGNKIIHVSFLGHFLGRINRLLAIMDESFPELGLQETNCTEMSWVSSTIFWAGFPIGSPIDVLLRKPEQPQGFFKSKSDYVKEVIPKAGLESIWKFMMEEGDEALMQWNPYGGKMHEISPSETPFPHRAGNLFLIQYWTFWEVEERSYHQMKFSRSFYEFMAQHVSKSPRETFLNYRDLDIGANPSGSTSMDIARGSYGTKYFIDNFERLVKAKTMVDPHNFFKYEQSIPPRS